MNTPAKRTLVNGCLLGLLLIAGFWTTPLLLTALEQLLPFFSTRWGYIYLLYGTSRWMGSVGSLWIVWMLRDTRLHLAAEWSLISRLAYLIAFAVGFLWIITYAVCAEPTMWFEGDASELLLFETKQQAKLFLGGLIAINILIRWFGLVFTRAEAGTVRLERVGEPEVLGLWLSLFTMSMLYLVLIIGVLYFVRGWRSCVWLRRMAYRWWGIVVFHTAVTPQTLQLGDPLPIILKMLILALFTATLFAALWRLKPAATQEQQRR